MMGSMVRATSHHATGGRQSPGPWRTIITPMAQRLRRIGALKRAILRLRQWRARAIDNALNIHTPYPHSERYRLDTQFGDAVPNEPVDYLLLRKFMKPLALSPQDVMYDIGCGMGRVVCMFAREKISRCIGIEFDPQLARIAEENARRLRGRRAEIEIRCCDAAVANYSAGTIYWMFNPFGSQTLEAVMHRLHQSVAQHPRIIQLVYVNPVHEHVLERAGWLERTADVQSPLFGGYGASYWRSLATGM